MLRNISKEVALKSTKMFSSLPKSKLSRHVARLNLISTGPGSVIVPKNVRSVELIFKRIPADGHMGPKKFWTENLPRVQFHNPELPIQVTRIEASKDNFKQVPALLKIHLSDGTVKSADIKNKHSDDILQEFIQLTESTPVSPN